MIPVVEYSSLQNGNNNNSFEEMYLDVFSIRLLLEYVWFQNLGR